LQLALTARVSYLVTGDGDLMSVQAVLPFHIVTAEMLRRTLA
jgi:predicted nucleic acid-binding protein